jgi:hypothetical protein
METEQLTLAWSVDHQKNKGESKIPRIKWNQKTIYYDFWKIVKGCEGKL